MADPVTENAMDHAAEAAAKDLMDNIPAEHAQAIALWWKKHYLKAGHKRLGRLLVKYATGGLPE